MIYSTLRLVALGFLVLNGSLTGCIPAVGGGAWHGSGTVGHSPAAEAARVVRVVDGDTYDVLANSVLVRVRLLGVDAPERDQPFGTQATDSVARCC